MPSPTPQALPVPEAPGEGGQRSGRDAVLESYRPFMEMDLGRGRELALSQKQFHWRGGPRRRLIVDLSNLAGVRLEKRRAWESFIFALVFGVAGASIHGLYLRLGFGALTCLAVVAALTHKKCTLRLRLKQGGERAIVLAIGKTRSTVVCRVDSIWDSLKGELNRLGVPT